MKDPQLLLTLTLTTLIPIKINRMSVNLLKMHQINSYNFALDVTSKNFYSCTVLTIVNVENYGCKFTIFTPVKIRISIRACKMQMIIQNFLDF
jgi:hypothetical protein